MRDDVLCPLKNFYLTLTSLQDILLPLTMPTTVTTKQLIIDKNNLNSSKWKLLLWYFFNERQKKPQKNFLVAFEDNLVYDFIYSTFERNIVCSFQAQLFEKWTRFELLARRGNFWDFSYDFREQHMSINREAAKCIERHSTVERTSRSLASRRRRKNDTKDVKWIVFTFMFEPIEIKAWS